MTQKRLYRMKQDRKICGVCSGIAVYFGIDSTIVRILWVILSLITVFAGIVLYIACVFIIPEEPDFYDVEYREK